MPPNTNQPDPLPEPNQPSPPNEPAPEPAPAVQQPADPNTVTADRLLVQDLMRQVAELRQAQGAATAPAPVEDNDPPVTVELWTLNEDNEVAKLSKIKQVYRKSEWEQLNQTMPGAKTTYLAFLGYHGKQID